MQTYSDLRSLCLYRYGVLMVCVCVCVCRAKQLLERRIHNGREELTRMKDKMERKREAAKGRKRDLELQHAASIEEKRHLDDEAFKKNLEAQAVEQHVRLVLSPLASGCSVRLTMLGRFADPRHVHVAQHRVRQGREGVQADQGADQCVPDQVAAKRSTCFL